jgi:hypothetical protein
MDKEMNENIKAGADIHAGDGGYSEGTQEEYEKFVKIRNQSLIKARIREFEKQSGLEIYGLGARRDRWEATMEKFTELVVKECMSNLYLHGYDDAMNQIKEYFGVEE